MYAELITREAQDREIHRRILDVLSDRFFPSLRLLLVEVRDGVAFIRGTVPTDYERRLAHNRVRGVRGVARLVDSIAVDVDVRPLSRLTA